VAQPSCRRLRKADDNARRNFSWSLIACLSALMSDFKDGRRIFPTPACCVGSGSDAGVQGRRRDRWTSVDLL
jgi:hypothetical protein